MKVGELDMDTMDCREPEAVWNEMHRWLKWRETQERGVAADLRRTADAAYEDALAHDTRADEFGTLATAMERASVTFPAIAAGSGTAETSEAQAQCEASQSGAESASPNPSISSQGS